MKQQKKLEKIEVRRNLQTHQIKALKALVKIENHGHRHGESRVNFELYNDKTKFGKI